MDIYVLNSSFERIGVIDYCQSVIWTKRYCNAGDFELYIPATDEALELLAINNLVMREDDLSSLMVIQTIKISTDEENGNYLTISGPSIESYLSRRIVWKQTNLSGLVTDCITQLINENVISPTITDRAISGIEIGTYCDCSTEITKQLTGDNLLDSIIGILTTYSLGFRLVFNNNTLEFEIYEGVDRSYDQNVNPYVVFSPEFDNVLKSDYSYDVTAYRNVALVAGEGEGASRKTQTVGNASGLSRIETYVDARDLSTDTEQGTISDEAYNQLLAERGNEKLAEETATEEFSGEIDATMNYELNVDYSLGDIVEVVNEYGISKSARIIEIIECWDDNGYSCTPTFEGKEQ